jgi:DNA-binding SARP family transcriptional activator
MGSLTITLLGPPAVVRDGEPIAAPKGKKVWALLGYLVRSGSPVSRERLASLLFADADDPLGALRWNLAELRRLLDDRVILRGEPLLLELPAATSVDVDEVLKGSWRQAVTMATLGGVFLEGLRFPSSAAFEAWLLTERRFLTNASADVMREAAIGRIAEGVPDDAVRLSRHLVELDPLDEAYQALLIRSLAAAGDLVAARSQLDACRALLMRELGVAPGPDVRHAIDTPPTGRRTATVGGRATAQAQLDAGRSAISAGAVDAGLDALRLAAEEAEQLGDPGLHAESLVALGSTLIHSLRGRDEEASVILHRAIALGEAADIPVLVAAARRELGYVELLRARYGRARAWLDQALDAAHDDVAEQGAIRAVLGACLSDTAHYPEAIAELEKAIALAEEAGGGRQTAFATSFLGRAQLLVGDFSRARTTLERSVDTAQGEGWTSFIPWPESMLGSCLLAEGDVEGAAQTFEHAFALGCHLGDPCWEGMAARGIGLVHARRGAVDKAVDWLDDARTRCVRVADAYRWVQVYCEDALCDVATTHDVDGAQQWIDELEAHAARADMRDFVARAYVHRSRAGDPSALAAATVLAAQVDSADLHRTLEAARSAAD